MSRASRVDSPRDLDEALDCLEGAPPGCLILAGGTDLMVEFQSGRTRPEHVVDVWGVDALRGIRETAAGELRLGALTTCAELVHSALAQERADVLVEAAAEVGALQIQNRATLGGNLGTASPAADMNPVLAALGARVGLVSRAGRRELPVEEFLTGYRTTARRPAELIEAVLLPARPAGERRAFRKVGTRRAQSISKVVVALAVTIDDGRIVRLRGAAGSVAPATVLLPSLERQLVGEVPTGELLRAAARESARRDAAPIDDVRSTARYRRVVLERLLTSLLEGLVGGVDPGFFEDKYMG